MLTPQHTQEGLHIAYIEAVAAAAGCNVATRRRHDYGVDGTFHSVVIVNGQRHEDGYALSFQAKATTAWGRTDEGIAYDLDVRNYNGLVGIAHADGATPHVLIVFCQPANEEDWLGLDDEAITLRKCCYWVHLTGERSTNSSSVRVHIPATNRFDPQSLQSLLLAVRNGDLRCGQ